MVLKNDILGYNDLNLKSFWVYREEALQRIYDVDLGGESRSWKPRCAPKTDSSEADSILIFILPIQGLEFGV